MSIGEAWLVLAVLIATTFLASTHVLDGPTTAGLFGAVIGYAGKATVEKKRNAG